ncbi:unnamed protein product [Ilex paraguariensis]|uniref:DYW domain-containing protein n=1 Tax=Ilex paraguariensis TaxID=185542 RepID=A0ABC8UEQ6_9AQUA
MIKVLPCSSFLFNPFSYSFCFKFQSLTYTKQQAPTLYNIINPRKVRNACCLQFHTDPNTESVAHSLICCAMSCSSVSICRVSHGRVIKSLNFSDGFIGDRLVSLYVKLDCLEDAQNLFDEMPNKDLVSWNSLISVFSRRGGVSECLNAFFRMKSDMGLEPNEVTLISILSACTGMGALNEGNYIHGFVVKTGLLLESKVANSLINMYGKLGFIDLASQLFEAIQVPNLVSWNSMVMVYVLNGCSEEAIGLFNTMREAGVKPDQATVVTLLQGCANIGVGNLGEAMHGYIITAGHNADINIATALLSFYAKSGRLSASGEVFRGMDGPDRIAWTAMLAANAVHGYGRDAIELFELMVEKGLQPDHVTFIHLLSACSHSGLVDEGKRYFEVMSTVYRVEPKLDHYSCMVDLFGRSGNLKDARMMVERMPMEPNAGVWGALLNACKVHGNIELGKEAAEKLCALNPSDGRNYIMLSNIYSAAGLWRNASNARVLMKEREVVKTPGCSFIEHGHKIHRFVVGDRSHPQTDRIYIKLEELLERIQKAGYLSKTEFVLHDVGENVKEDMINKHSEKLAIAFGLLVTGAGMPLIITKNLRICGDCHSMAKFVSLIEKRMIIIRDTKRFHHFSDGLCSCGDYW